MAENDKPLFQGMDELERTYAPQELPPDDPARKQVRADEHGDDAPTYGSQGPLSGAPVGNLGDHPTPAITPLDVAREERRGAPGDPSTQADSSLDNEGD